MEMKINPYPTLDKNAEFLCIEYPGVVLSVNNMFATLGGLQHIRKVYSDPSKRLDLRYRPEDPCCNPLCADRIPCMSLLLKVSRYKRKKKNENKSIEDEYMHRQHICGIINTKYKFQSLCDYQYLSLKKDEKTGNFKSLIPYLTINESVIEDDLFFTKEAPLFLPPPTYGRLDTPHNYEYKKKHTNYRKTTQRTKTSWEKNVSSRKGRFHHCYLVKFEENVPTEGMPKALERAKLYPNKSAEEILKKAFESRPIWSRNALQITTGLVLYSLQVLLPSLAFYIVSGPWARLWVRFGYDPKLNPEALKYQLIDFRLRQGLGADASSIPIRAKRNIFNYKLPHIGVKQRQVTDQSPASFVLNSSQQNDNKESDGKKSSLLESVYLYQPGVLPAHRQIYYQLCDIRLPEVQEAAVSSKRLELACSKEDGWMKPNSIAEIRNMIAKDIYKTLTIKKYGSPREFPKSLTIPGESSAKSKHIKDAPNFSDDTDLLQNDDMEADADFEDGSESSTENESLLSRSQDDPSEDTFGMVEDDDPLDDEDFDEDGLFFGEEQIIDVSVMGEDLTSK